MGCLIVAVIMAVFFAIELPWLWYGYVVFIALVISCLLVEKIEATHEAKVKLKQEAARIISKELMTFRMCAGRAVYTSEPIKEGLPCKVVVTGQDSLHPQVNDAPKIDAVYIFGEQQYTRHNGLLFDGQPAMLFEEDPHNHKFSFVYRGAGRQLSLVLKLPQGRSRYSSIGYSDPFSVSIRTLTVAEEAEVKAQEDQRLQEAIADQREELRRRALDLATLAQMEQDLLQPDHQQHFAAKHIAEIVTTWAERWRKEYLALKVDAPLYALIQEQYPEVLAFYEARVAVTRIAKRLAVEPPPAPDRKETPNEYRDRQLRGFRIDADDKIAKLLSRYESRDRLRERAEQLGFAEDLIEGLEQELLGDLVQDDDSQNNGYRQLG
jgi:hypothetical protein